MFEASVRSAMRRLALPRSPRQPSSWRRWTLGQPASGGGTPADVTTSVDGVRQGSLLRGRRAASGHRRRRTPRVAAGRWRTSSSSGVAGVRPRPADAGAAEHGRRLVQPRDGRVAGRPRLDEQHVPHQRPARSPTGRPPSTASTTCSRPRRSRSPPSAAASRSRRSSGPAAGTPPSRARRSTSGRSSRAAAWRPTSSAKSASRRSTTHRSSRRSGSSSTIPPAMPGSGRSRAPRPRRRPAGPDVPASNSPPMEMRLRVLDFGVDKYGLWALHLSTRRTTGATRLRPACCSRATKNGADAVGEPQEGEWADVKVKIAGRPDRTA